MQVEQCGLAPSTLDQRWVGGFFLFNRFAHSAGPGREPQRVEAVGGDVGGLMGRSKGAGAKLDLRKERQRDKREESRERREEHEERREKRAERPEEAARGPAMKPPEGNQPFRAPYRPLREQRGERREERREQQEERRDPKRGRQRTPNEAARGPKGRKGGGSTARIASF